MVPVGSAKRLWEEGLDILDFCACSGGNLPRFVQPVLLALLAEESMHGYVLVQKLGETGLFGAQVPDMTGCYRMLRDMERSGVLETSTDRGEGPQRKKYRVTALGRRCLNRWIDSLTRSRDHTERVLSFLLAARLAAMDGGGYCPEEERLFMEDVRKRAMNGEMPRREDVLRLLAYAPGSPEEEYLGRLARETAREAAGNRAGVWAAIGVDSAPCSMNCAFCAFGEAWGVVREKHELSEEEIVVAARRYAAEGASWMVLRTTEHYGLERLCRLAGVVRASLPKRCALVANTGQKSREDIRRLHEAGFGVMYHALRLGEGKDTPFDPKLRREALCRIGREDVALACLVEPLGGEHGNEEIADVMLAAMSAGAQICGVMARVNVPGTPYEGRAGVPEARLARVAAVVRLCGGIRTPYVCVHPPLSQAVEWGANVVVVETGAVPRESGEVSGEWQGFTVRDARELFLRHGYVLKADADRDGEVPGAAREVF